MPRVDPQEKATEVAKFLKNLRFVKGWTQRDLARKLKVNQSYINDIERSCYQKMPLAFIKSLYQSSALSDDDRELLMRSLHKDIMRFVKKR